MDSNVELEMKRRENGIWVSLSDVKRRVNGSDFARRFDLNKENER